MEAIEFQATIGSDGTIAIPENLAKKVRRGKVRVIVIEDDRRMPDREEAGDRDRSQNYIKFLMANPIKVDSSIPLLTRDEIHDRRI
ncbi:MAG: hypothetical protein KF855_17825 [Acidobacteria bacterium]|nr:hypothetical protein [Acidobacteriota bacterium]